MHLSRIGRAFKEATFRVNKVGQHSNEQVVVAKRTVACPLHQVRCLYGSSSRKEPASAKEKLNIDMLGTWDTRTDLPLELESSINFGKPIPKVLASAAGAYSLQGRRPYNEDRFVIKELKPNLLYFAVFDGHGGSECAEFCHRYLENHLLFWINYGEKDLEKVLDLAFLEINNSFARWWAFNGKASASAPGTTATVALLYQNVELYLGHVGDSRAILCRDGEARKLTSDHCPSLLAEKTRITRSGGQVITDSMGRNLVNGRLAMTRSIGDLELKPYGVIPVPDVRKLQIKHSRDSFLVLTTDGINCALTDQEICQTVSRAEDPKEAAHLLADQAVHYSSEDNATALVVPLGSWDNNSKSASIFYSFGRSMSVSSRFS